MLLKSRLNSGPPTIVIRLIATPTNRELVARDSLALVYARPALITTPAQLAMKVDSFTHHDEEGPSSEDSR